MKPVKFKKRYSTYAQGMIASFPEAFSDRLIQMNVAEEIAKETPKKEHIFDKMIRPKKRS